jgi:plasmid stabilization system protein ParE
VSNKVWYCENCGYEVNSRGRCHSCGARLIASTLPELESGPDDDEVGYRLDQWDDRTRARLIESLMLAGVLHRFEEEELVILAVDEAEVDRLVDVVTGMAAPARGFGDDDDDELATPEEAKDASRELYDAAKRLRDNPTDMQADAALGEASAAVFAVDYLPDMDEYDLAAVGRVTRRLLGALGADEALEDEIRHQAEVLCRLIAPSAGEAESLAETERARARLERGAKETRRLVALPHSKVTPGGEMGGPTLDLAEEAKVVEADDDEVGTAGQRAHEPPDLSKDGGPDADRLVDGDDAEDDVDDDDEGEDDENSGELVYELAEWLPEQRVELSMLLESAGVAYNWDGPDLTVAEDYETEVDGLFEQVHGLLDDDDEARDRSIEELFGAVDRLANDPGNEERRAAFLGAVAAVELPTPVGVDDAYWWRVRSQGHVVVGALDNGARNEDVSRESALLAEMLHEMV